MAEAKVQCQGPDRVARGWIHNYARKNYWRVASWVEFEDLIQDANMLYVEVVQIRLPPDAQQEHIMSYFQTCFRNHITDLANRRTRSNETAMSEMFPATEEGNSALEDLLGAEMEQASFMTLLAQAPAEVKAVLNLLMTDAGLVKLRSDYERPNGVRETTNERLCRLAGYDSTQVNLVQMVKDHFAAA